MNLRSLKQRLIFNFMADIILGRKQVLAIMEGKPLDSKYSNFEDQGFLSVPLVIDVIEREKKNHKRIPSMLKSVINNLPEYDYISCLGLSSNGLCRAMNDLSFVNKYLSREGNPLEFATEASFFEFDGWWDILELQCSFQELTWT